MVNTTVIEAAYVYEVGPDNSRSTGLCVSTSGMVELFSMCLEACANKRPVRALFTSPVEITFMVEEGFHNIYSISYHEWHENRVGWATGEAKITLPSNRTLNNIYIRWHAAMAYAKMVRRMT